MSQLEGHIPPSRGRLARAYAAVGFPRSRMLTGGVLLLIFGAVVMFGGDQATETMVNFFRQGLSVSAARPRASDAALEMLRSIAWQLLPILAVIFVVAMLAAILPALFARRLKGTTEVPLPPLKTGRTARLVLKGFGGAVSGLAILAILKETTLAGQDARAILAITVRTAGQLAMATGVLLVLVGAIEMILIRHFLWRSLFLNTAEAKRERRAQESDPRVRQEQRSRPRRMAT